MKKAIFSLLILLLSGSIEAQKLPLFAVELAAFDQPVELSYFQNMTNVYETLDINKIYRYHIAANSQQEAQQILEEAIEQGYAHARIIDFEAIKEICANRCGFIAPKRTGMSNENSRNNAERLMPDAHTNKSGWNAAPDLIECIFFDFSSSHLSNDSKKTLNQLVQVLLKNKDFKVQLSGHADAIGNDTKNQLISEQRVENTRQYLLSQGILPQQIESLAFGKNQPIAINKYPNGNDAAEGRRYNRRVQWTVLDAQGNSVNILSKTNIPNHLRIRH